MREEHETGMFVMKPKNETKTTCEVSAGIFYLDKHDFVERLRIADLVIPNGFEVGRKHSLALSETRIRRRLLQLS